MLLGYDQVPLPTDYRSCVLVCTYMCVYIHVYMSLYRYGNQVINQSIKKRYVTKLNEYMYINMAYSIPSRLWREMDVCSYDRKMLHDIHCKENLCRS